MEPESRYAWVGVAVLALVAFLAAGMYWLNGGTENKFVNRYTVYFEKQSLEGLQIGSDVRMQGIKVGKVEDYAIIPGQARRVRTILQVDARTPVLEGVHAEVARHLVTGLAAIDLINVAEGGPPLKQIPEGEDHPVIPEGVPQLARVASTLEQMSNLGQDTLVRMNTLLSDENQKSIQGILSNMNGVTRDLRKTVPELNATLASARQVSARLEVLSDDADQLMRSTDARLAKVADRAESAMISAQQTLDAMDKEIHGTAMQLRLSADLATQEIQTTALSLRLAGDALQDTGRAMADPARILYGASESDLGPGERP